MDITGILTEWVDPVHIVLQENGCCRLKHYIGIDSSISQLQVGNTFSATIYPRFQFNKIKKCNTGDYKLVFILMNDTENNNLHVYFHFFKNKNNGKLISTTLNEKLNEGVLGEYYDLDLNKDYKVRNILPYLPENKNNNYTKLLLTKKYNDLKYYGFIGNEQINLSSGTLILDSYLGNYVLAEIQPKYLCPNIIIGNKVLKPSNTDFELVTSFGRLNYFRQLDKYNPSNNILRVISTLYEISNNNIGKIFNLNYYKIKVILLDTLQITNNKSDNQLVQIIQRNYYNYKVNLFKLDNGETIAINSQSEINFNNKLGSYFKFQYKQLYYLTKISYSENPDIYYTLSAVLTSGIYIFNRNGEDYFVNLGEFTIADSSIGKNFSLDLKEYYFSDFVNDVIV